MNRTLLMLLSSGLLGGTSCLNVGCHVPEGLAIPSVKFVHQIADIGSQELDKHDAHVTDMFRSAFPEQAQAFAEMRAAMAEFMANSNDTRAAAATADTDVGAKAMDVAGMFGLGAAEGPLGILLTAMGFGAWNTKKKNDATAVDAAAAKKKADDLERIALVNAPPPATPAVPIAQPG